MSQEKKDANTTVETTENPTSVILSIVIKTVVTIIVAGGLFLLIK